MKRILLTLAALCLAIPLCFAQKGADKVEADRTVWDFGDILVSQGPVSCSFNIKNVSSAPLTILNVVSSCGCTDVTWERDSFKPGESAKVTATYKNDAGPYPFDKTLTVYVSDVKQPLVLHLRGMVHEKAKPLGELYPVRFGDLGLKDAEIKGGNLVQGRQKSGEVKVANLGKSPIELTFKDVDSGLSIIAPGAKLAPGEVSSFSYTITADRSHWGTSRYFATPVVNGRPAKGQLCFRTVIKEDFSSMSKEEKASAANPMFDTNTFNFGRVKAGTKVNAVFSCKNVGKTPLKVFKADSDCECVEVGDIPDLKPSREYRIEASADTKGMEKGEALIIVTLITNSPLRPIVNLYISGYLE